MHMQTTSNQMPISLSNSHVYFILLEVSSSNSVWSYGSLQSTECCSHWTDPFCLLIYRHDKPTYTLAAQIKHTTIQFYIFGDSYSNLVLPNPTTLLESIICEYVCAMYMLCSMCMWVSAYDLCHMHVPVEINTGHLPLTVSHLIFWDSVSHWNWNS